jgi:predicted nucleotidyltransferase
MNAREQEIKEQIRRQVARAGRQLAGYRVFLFGSRACGTARPRSDFDVDMNRVTAAFRAEAMQHTEVLYAP